jgi:DNA-binding response OmpR family regulator
MAAQEVVLLVNDIPDHVARYERVLTRHGFRVRVARSGKEAIAAARESLPDCAVIDLRLPDMSGWDVCRELRSPQQWDPPRIIVLTPEVSKMCAVDGAKAGCHAWLAHPTVAEDLATTVRQVLDYDTDAPSSTDDALVGFTTCPVCGSESVRSTLRVGVIQYYCCRACAFCWRAETMTPNA